MIYVLLILAFILTEGYYSGSETGAYCLNKIRMRFKAGEGTRRAVVLQRLLADPQGLICTTLIGTNLSVYLSTALLTSRLELMHVPTAEVVSTLCLAPLLMVFAETIPKSIFQARANVLMYTLAPSLAFFRRLFAPGVWVLKKITGRFAPAASQQERAGLFTSGRLTFFLDQGAHEGILSSYQRAMAGNVMKLGKTPVEKAMIRLSQAVLIPKSAGSEEFAKVASENRFSRIPVYEESPERIVGVINLLDFFCAEAGETLENLMRPVVAIPADKAIDDALLLLQQASSPMGIVVDEKGAAVGIVTIKDLVEEIVGELEVW